MQYDEWDKQLSNYYLIEENTITQTQFNFYLKTGIVFLSNIVICESRKTSLAI